RTRLQDDLLAMQASRPRTIIFVSHDLDEAFKLGDRIALMDEGRIVQTGTALDILRNPANAYVGEFVAHMNPMAVLSAAALAGPGEAPGAPRPGTLPAREVMSALTMGEALPVGGGGRVTRAGVLRRLAHPGNGRG